MGSASQDRRARPDPFADGAPRPLAQHGTREEPGVARQLAGLVGKLVAALAVAGLVLGVVAAVHLGASLRTFDLAAPPAATDTGDDGGTGFAEIPGGANVLLVGSDDREGQGEGFGEGNPNYEGRRNDVTILVHLSQDRTRLTAVSIPRDTLVDRPACTADDGTEVAADFDVRVNTALGAGGMNCAVSTVEALSGMDVHYAAMLDRSGAIEMSNAVGGVDVCLEHPIDDPITGLYLPAGTNTLQGERAFNFLWTRHGVGDESDLARVSNQQVFLAALVRKVRAGDTLTDPAKLYGLASAAARNMTLSSNLTYPATLAGFARLAVEIDPSRIAFVRMPVGADPDDPDRLVPAEPDAAEFWQALAADSAYSLEPAPGSESADASSGDASASGGATVGPESTGTTPSTPAAPPPNVDGQTAADETCSVGTS